MRYSELTARGLTAETISPYPGEAFLYDVGNGVWKLSCFYPTTSDNTVTKTGTYAEMRVALDSFWDQVEKRYLQSSAAVLVDYNRTIPVSSTVRSGQSMTIGGPFQINANVVLTVEANAVLGVY